MSDLSDLRAKIAEQFQAAFGRTPLAERVEDIVAQATTLGRFTDLDHLRDEAGDLLAAVLQLCNENGWEPAELVAATLTKIASRRDIYARLGRKLRVVLLGGAFDPVHNGHLQVAQEVLRLGGIDEVWLMPCFDHLSGKAMASPDHRLAMCRLATDGVRGVGVYDYEIRHEFRGETYHLIKNLLAEDVARTRCDFRFIIGQDNADTLSSWTNAEALERMIPFLVVPRPGSEPPPPSAWYLRPPHHFLDEAVQLHAISSTEVRNRIRSGDTSVGEIVPPEVLEYIRRHDLYRTVSITSPANARKIAVFSSTFDPPSRYHHAAAEKILALGFDEVVVCPAGPRGGRQEREHAKSMHRAAMCDLNFQELPRATVDLTDLDHGHFSTPLDLDLRYQDRAEVWHVVSADSVEQGCEGRCAIQTRWEQGEEMWKRSRFIVLHATALPPRPEDVPPQAQLVAVDGHVPSAELRDRVYHGQSIGDWVIPEVDSYIRRQQLFLPSVSSGPTRLQVADPRLLIECDDRNPNALALAERYRRYASPRPNLILVLGGDGTMLRAIRRHWRKRIPIVGLNAGHVGFLANERLPQDLEGAEFVLYSLPMIRVDAEKLATEKGQPPTRTSGLAFGDAWIERDGGQAAWLRLDVDGQTRVPKIVGDGMLVATASGSSAYARALARFPCL